MVDNLRYELTQVARRCKGIELGLPEINKILNGKFDEVIDDFKNSPKPETELFVPVEPEQEQESVEENSEEEPVPDAEEE